MQEYTENKLKIFVFRQNVWNDPKQTERVKNSEIITNIHAGRFF